jgi:hypothetical protein
MNDLLAVAGVIGTVLFGVLSIIFYLKSRRFRRLDALWSTVTLQSRRHEDVRILFRGEEIADLSRLRILFVNTGTEPIRGESDIPSKFEGAVTISRVGDRTRFLSAACLVGDIEVCRALSEIDNSGNTRLTFEYLNPGQRVGVEVLYSGPVPVVNGQLIGGSVRLRRSSGRDWVDEFSEMWPTLVLALMLLGLVGGREVATAFGISPDLVLLAGIALAAGLTFIAWRFALPVWRRYRGESKQRLGLDFLAGRERPNEVLHQTAALPSKATAGER